MEDFTMRKLITFLLLICTILVIKPSYAIDVAIGIEELVPAAQYGGSVNDGTEQSFNALRWEDIRPKPTWQEVVDAYNQYVIDKPAKDLAAIRTRLIAEIQSDLLWRAVLEVDFEKEVLLRDRLSLPTITKQEYIDRLVDKINTLLP